MKLVYPHDVARVGVVRVFRHSRLSPLITLLFVAGLTVWWTVAIVQTAGRMWYHWLPTVLGGIVCLVVLVYLQKAMKASNWLVKVTEDGLFIQYRSYLNDGLPVTGPTVVHIPYSEIASAKSGARVIRFPDRENRITSHLFRHLDLELRHDATSELAHTLREERGLGPVRNGAAKHHDYPLRVVGPGRLRLEWNVRPKLSAALDSLERFVPIESEVPLRKLDWNAMDDAARQELIVELAELGEKMHARALVEALYHYEREEAKAYVDQLMGRAR